MRSLSRTLTVRLSFFAAACAALHCASASKQATPHSARDGGGDAAAGFCGSCTLTEEAHKVALPASSELSGLSASAVHSGVYYVQNDSGDEPRFFALAETGELRGTFRVKGAVARDWEDLAVGPCDASLGESCVFLWDGGDNDAVRKDTVLYRVREPTTLDGKTVEVSGEAIPFRYPDRSHDCEALLVHPKTGRVVVVTKERNGPSLIFVFPAELRAGTPVTLTLAGELKPPDGSPLVTAGSVHPEGRGVLLRTYTHAFYFAGEPGQAIEEMLKSPPCAVPVATEAQGESIGWMRSGAGYVTVSEGIPMLHPVRCGG